MLLSFDCRKQLNINDPFKIIFEFYIPIFYSFCGSMVLFTSDLHQTITVAELNNATKLCKHKKTKTYQIGSQGSPCNFFSQDAKIKS